MGKIWELLKREHMLNGAHSYVVFALLVLLISFLPIGVERYSDWYTAEEIRFAIVMFGASAVGLNAVIMTIASINRDVKMKELWLHSTQSIYTLIGVKVVYQFAVLLVLGLVNYIGLFFVGDIVEGTFGQFLGLACLYLYLLASGFFVLSVFMIFINSLSKQLSVWIGKISFAVVFIGVFVLVSMGDIFPPLTFLQIGLIELPSIDAYLPKFNDAIISVHSYISFYIVEEVFYIVFLIGSYMLSCKWLERVITR